MKNFFLFFILMGFIGLQSVLAQTTVTGTVTSTVDGSTLPGVSVVVKGTNLGTTTGINGKYQLNVPANAKAIVFSFVGMKTQTIAFTGQAIINVRLTSSAVSLGQVVVVGYGTQSKRRVTSAISSIGAAKINNIPTPSLQSAFVGKAAGVLITQTNGKLESGIKVHIRGISTITASQEPLYVVDGIPILNTDESTNSSPINPLLFLNPNDIASVEILKDASSEAIYGARGSNGVILITTKKGKQGKTRISLNYSTGFSRTTHKRDWLNTAQYIELFDEAAKNSGYTLAQLHHFYTLYSWDGKAEWNSSVNTNWQNLALVKGSVSNYNISASGGNRKTTFFISSAYNKTDGIVFDNKLQRYSIRANVENHVSDKLKIGTNTSFSRIIIDRVSNDDQFSTPLQAIAQTPFTRPFDANGVANRHTLYYNFLVQAQDGSFQTNIWHALINMYAEYQIIPSLKFRSEVAYDYNGQLAEEFSGSLTEAQGTNGFAIATSHRTERYDLNNYFTFTKNFNEDHRVNITLGTSFEKSILKAQHVEGTDFPSDALRTLQSAGNITGGASSLSAYDFLGYFARVAYSYKNKYLLNASIRRDGSSRFGINNQFGWFPAASIGWILSDEDFLKDSHILSLLKLRASWGVTGNAGIGNFASRSLFQGSSYNQKAGLAPTQLGNPNLKWERTSQIDVGINFGFFKNNRIGGVIDYYKKKTSNLLLNEPIPGTSGFQTITKNIGSMQNTGVEFMLNTKNVVTNGITWTTSFNISYNKNKVISLPNGDIIEGRNIVRQGEAISDFYMPEYAGVDPANGDALYYLNTLNPDGSRNRNTTKNYSDAKRVIVGNPFPNVIMGLSNTFYYKGLDFSFTFQAQRGASIYNLGGRFQEANGNFFDNQTVHQLQRWQKPGDITDVPQARLFGNNGTHHSTRYLQKANFVRLRNITIGYSFPKQLVEKLKLDQFRVYVTGFNLLTITKYTGNDPESTADYITGVSNIQQGIAFYSAPPAKTVTLGVNINF
ncbi:MAG: TonB-dependent receptor [Chlorobi bacterium]|nr:TonB-dependent receptor [Chlorobiota bacterium]